MKMFEDVELEVVDFTAITGNIVTGLYTGANEEQSYTIRARRF